MIEFLKRLFLRNSVSPTPVSAVPSPEESPGEEAVFDSDPDLTFERRAQSRYFETMALMLEAIARRDFGTAAELARCNIDEIPDMVQSCVRDYGSFDLQGVPGLEQGGTMLALARDRDALLKARRVIARIPELGPWQAEPDRHLANLELFIRIEAEIASAPGCLQTEVKALAGESDGRRVANLISWLEKAGRIRRIRYGKTYRLYSAASPEAPVPEPPRIAKSHRVDREPVALKSLDLSKLPLIPLPRAPLRWEEAAKGRIVPFVEVPDESFELRESPSWSILSIEKIPMGERPDPAFRKYYAIDRGLLLVDDLGKASSFPSAPASAVSFGPHGEHVATAPLLHDVYRTGTNPLGRSLIALSRACVLHAYDADLRPIIETAILESPELRRVLGRLQLDQSNLKSYLRSVAMSSDSSRYLLSAVDEAWCISTEGRGIWGLKLPVKEEWRPVTGESATFGTSQEVSQALLQMELSLPFSHDDLKKRYRDLARRCHPDLNPGDPSAEERMKKLNEAAEILTGLDSRALSSYTGIRYEKKLGGTTIELGDQGFSVSFSMLVGELEAADWIRSAAFAGRTRDVFLASDSGNVIQVGPDGDPRRVFHTGTTPRQIADTGDYLYFLTDTRLYILRGESLQALVDIADGGSLIIAQTGIGLLEKNRFRWLSEDGTPVGTVLSRDPIRRVYWTPTGLIVESRQRRSTISGQKSWWD